MATISVQTLLSSNLPAGPTGPTGPTGTTGPTGPTGSPGPVAGSTTQVIYNNAGSAAGSANFTFDGTNGVLEVWQEENQKWGFTRIPRADQGQVDPFLSDSYKGWSLHPSSEDGTPLMIVCDVKGRLVIFNN